MKVGREFNFFCLLEAKLNRYTEYPIFLWLNVYLIIYKNVYKLKRSKELILLLVWPKKVFNGRIVKFLIGESKLILLPFNHIMQFIWLYLIIWIFLLLLIFVEFIWEMIFFRVEWANDQGEMRTKRALERSKLWHDEKVKEI